MNKVTTIHLQGRAYRVEEMGYVLLRNYIDEAESRLLHDPARDEIVADLEYIVSEKADTYLTARKNVITTKEITQIIQDIGPVGDVLSSHGDVENRHTSGSRMRVPKRLYRIREGAVIGGVCKGFAVYFDADVTVVRVIFVIVGVLTGGVWVLVYILLMLIVPYAETPEERAFAYGTTGLTAQELVDRTRESFAHFGDEAEWRKWRQAIKDQRRRMRYERRRSWRATRPPLWWLFRLVWLLLWLLLLSFAVWYGYHYYLPFHEFIDLIANTFRVFFNSL